MSRLERKNSSLMHHTQNTARHWLDPLRNKMNANPRGYGTMSLKL
jgi:hypothetical protein